MTQPTPRSKTTKLGPGTLTIGATGSLLDISCQVNGMRLTPSKDTSDSVTKLCGTVVPGTTTYTYALSGNLDVDVDPDGFAALGYAEPGSVQPFTFSPNTASGLMVSGELVIDPLELGADAYGDPLASDVEFQVVGAPTIDWGGSGGGGGGTDTVTETVTATV